MLFIITSYLLFVCTIRLQKQKIRKSRYTDKAQWKGINLHCKSSRRLLFFGCHNSRPSGEHVRPSILLLTGNILVNYDNSPFSNLLQLYNFIFSYDFPLTPLFRFLLPSVFRAQWCSSLFFVSVRSPYVAIEGVSSVKAFQSSDINYQ